MSMKLSILVIALAILNVYATNQFTNNAAGSRKSNRVNLLSQAVGARMLASSNPQLASTMDSNGGFVPIQRAIPTIMDLSTPNTNDVRSFDMNSFMMKSGQQQTTTRFMQPSNMMTQQGMQQQNNMMTQQGMNQQSNMMTQQGMQQQNNMMTQQGMNQQGMKQQGNQQGMNLQGINLQGMSQQGMNQQGMNQQGNQQGMNLQGMNLQGMNQQGMNQQGMSQQGMNQQGMSQQGMNQQGGMIQQPQQQMQQPARMNTQMTGQIGQQQQQAGQMMGQIGQQQMRPIVNQTFSTQPISRAPMDLCSTNQVGDIIAHPSNPQQFVICYGFGEFTIMDCPEHLVYNSHLIRCDLDTSVPPGCSSNPCLNNGKCIDLPQLFTFRCECPAGFTGQTCEKVDTCSSKPCGPDGVCVSMAAGSPVPNVCMCNSGRTVGTSCNQQSVEMNPCFQPNSNLKQFPTRINPSIFIQCEGLRPHFVFCQFPLVYSPSRQTCDWTSQ